MSDRAEISHRCGMLSVDEAIAMRLAGKTLGEIAEFACIAA